MIETVHFVDTATFGGLGGNPHYVFSKANFRNNTFNTGLSNH